MCKTHLHIGCSQMEAVIEIFVRSRSKIPQEDCGDSKSHLTQSVITWMGLTLLEPCKTLRKPLEHGIAASAPCLLLVPSFCFKALEVRIRFVFGHAALIAEDSFQCLLYCLRHASRRAG